MNHISYRKKKKRLTSEELRETCHARGPSSSLWTW